MGLGEKTQYHLEMPSDQEENKNYKMHELVNHPTQPAVSIIIFIALRGHLFAIMLLQAIQFQSLKNYHVLG